MGKKIYFIGNPGIMGGVETELISLIELLISYKVEVHIVYGLQPKPKVEEYLKSIGVIIEEYKKNLFKNEILVVFFSVVGLWWLPEIERPKTIIYFNCCTGTMIADLNAHKLGLIDLHGFHCEYQRNRLKPNFEQLGPVKEFKNYVVYLNPKNPLFGIDFQYNRVKDTFIAGRISRNFPNKWAQDTWKIFDDIKTPNKKQVLFLGYGSEVENKTGKPPKRIDCKIYDNLGIPVREYLKIVHCNIHKTGGSRENYPRVAIECFAAGVPFIAENNYGFLEQIIDKETGFLCNTSEEMSAAATELAFNEKYRKKIIYAAYDRFNSIWGNRELCWQAWKVLWE